MLMEVELVSLPEAVCVPKLLVAELVDVTGLASGTGHKTDGPKRQAEISPHMCNNACNLELTCN